LYEIIWEGEDGDASKICQNIRALASDESKKGAIRKIIEFYQIVEDTHRRQL
jgi:hypothetical protein